MGTRFLDALRNVRAHRRRFALTATGVVWGAFMLSFMSSQSGGFSHHFRSELEEVGPKLIYMGSGRVVDRRTGSRKTREPEFDRDDTDRIEPFASVARVTPNIGVYNQTVRGGGRTKLLNVLGINVAGLEIRNFEIAKGRAFTPLEVQRAARVALLGPRAASRLFGREPALGRRLLLSGTPFRVVGVLRAKGEQLINAGNPDDLLVVLPFTAAQRWLNHDDRVKTFVVAPTRREEGETTIRDVRNALALHHEFTPPQATTAVWAANFWDTLQLVFGMFVALQLFLVVAGAITLFVGAVGVMNIMFVVIGERTHEIGLRKAIGATSGEIFWQFLFEASIVSISAGVLGAVLGFGAQLAARDFFARHFDIIMPAEPDPMTTIAVSVSLIVVAIIAGVLPAIQAARVPPAEALRSYSA